MSVLEYRCYKPGDEREIVQLWNEALPLDPITLERFMNLVLLDGNFDPEGLRLAFAQGQLVGCCYAVRRLLPMVGTDWNQKTAGFPFSLCAPSSAGRDWAQPHGTGTGVSQGPGPQKCVLCLLRTELHFAGPRRPGLCCRLGVPAEAGFRQVVYGRGHGSELGRLCPAGEVRALIKQREAEGYTFKTAASSDLVELIRFANEKFNPDWGRAIREGILQGLPLSRIFVARHRNRLVGFCLHGGYEGIPERFGPFGVDEEQRGKGLGKILLHLCLSSMRAEGLHGAWFLWTGETSPAGHLYRSVGFEVSRRFYVCKKELVEEGKS